MANGASGCRRERSKPRSSTDCAGYCARLRSSFGPAAQRGNWERRFRFARSHWSGSIWSGAELFPADCANGQIPSMRGGPHRGYRSEWRWRDVNREIPLRLRKRTGRELMIVPEGATTRTPQRARVDNAMAKAIAPAHRWREMLESREYSTIFVRSQWPRRSRDLRRSRATAYVAGAGHLLRPFWTAASRPAFQLTPCLDKFL